MEKTIHTQINKIRIGTFSIEGIGGKWIEDPTKIKRLVELIEQMEQKAEECPYFVDSPELARFRIEFYKDKEHDPFYTITVAGPFIRRDDEWYWIGHSSLQEELVKCTKDIAPTKIGCTFG